MPDRSWKAFERRVAQSLGGKRTGAFGDSISDVEGTAFSVECKRTQRTTGGILGSWISQARRQGLVEGRPWILVVGMAGSRTPVVVLDFAMFVGIARDAGLILQDDDSSSEVEKQEETYRTNFGRTLPR